MMDFIADDALTPADESRYVNAYLPLVHRVVKQLSYQASSVMDREDMEQIALMGLLTSLRRYGHPDEQFGAYACTVFGGRCSMSCVSLTGVLVASGKRPTS